MSRFWTRDFCLAFPAVQSLMVAMAGHHQRGTANSTFYAAFDVGVGLGIFLAGPFAQAAGLPTAFWGSAFTTLAGAAVLGLALRRQAVPAA